MLQRLIIPISFACVMALPVQVAADSSVLDEMLSAWAEAAERPFSVDAGIETWNRVEGERSCTTCHTDSVHSMGRHVKTGKVIEPMAPSINPERLTERRKINKWFLRNCKWTFGRECTPQEKGDVVVWLRDQ